MFVELAYGIWSNSLGLISDACHMLFDCVALAIGLLAAIIAKWEANQGFTYGYTRVQVLSGYVNGIFLIFISFSIFREAVHRIVDPPDITLDKLLIVSVAGLCVNLFGMFAFSHAHSHGGEPCGGHGGGGGDNHGHSHGGDNHGHSHGGEAPKAETDENMMGVYLHVMADTMGSVGVIISTLLIEWFGWTISDPICSLVLGILILLSVFPLIKGSSRTLLQEPSETQSANIPELIDQVRQIEGVSFVTEHHFWKLDSHTNVGTLIIQASDEADEQSILLSVTRTMRDFGINNTTVQINKHEGELDGWNHGFGEK